MLPQRVEVGTNVMISSGDIVVVDTDTSNDLFNFQKQYFRSGRF